MCTWNVIAVDEKLLCIYEIRVCDGKMDEKKNARMELKSEFFGINSDDEFILFVWIGLDWLSSGSDFTYIIKTVY